MPPVGLEPATSTYSAQTITQLTKWAGDAENEITHSHICAKIPPAGLEPATSTHSAQTRTQITKYTQKRPTQFHQLKIWVRETGVRLSTRDSDKDN